MKKVKTLLCIILTLLFTAGLCGCTTFDPLPAVNGYMELLTTGKVSDDLVEATGETKEELQKEYDEIYDEVISDMLSTAASDQYSSILEESDIREFMETMFSSIKYEVSDEYTEENGTYYVDIKVYPPLWTQSVKSYVSNEFFSEWESKLMNGEYVMTSEEQLISDLYDDLFGRLLEMAKNTEYGEPKTVEVRIEPQGDYYYINETDLDRIYSTAFPAFL